MFIHTKQKKTRGDKTGVRENRERKMGENLPEKIKGEETDTVFYWPSLSCIQQQARMISSMCIYLSDRFNVGHTKVGV